MTRSDSKLLAILGVYGTRLVAGCGHSTIALDAGVVLPAGARAPDPLMDVTGTVSGGRDPLPVDGAPYAFSSLTTTMTR